MGKGGCRLKRFTIVLQNEDGSHCRFIGIRERDELRFAKPPQIIKAPRYKGKKKTGIPTRETWRLIPQPIAIRDMHEASPPSITNREMRVFAGVEDGNRKRVRAKVKAHGSFRWNVKIHKKIEETGVVFTEFV